MELWFWDLNNVFSLLLNSSTLDEKEDPCCVDIVLDSLHCPREHYETALGSYERTIEENNRHCFVHDDNENHIHFTLDPEDNTTGRWEVKGFRYILDE